jgi:signal transduction histidine kinase
MSFESDDFERRLIAELEAQQTHIAQELHDALGSQLTAMVMLLAALQKTQKLQHAPSHLTDQLMQQAQAAVQTTRTLARGLMPLDQEPGSLWRVLERLCLDYDQIPELSCHLDVPDNLYWVRPDIANPLYRIAQEALTNAFRSGRAQQVIVSFARLDGQGCMTVQDDGIGMHHAQRGGALGQGVGLRTMSARAKVIGATLAFEKNNIAGTTVRVTWPVASLSQQVD